MPSDINEDLRAKVARRAGLRCEYCLIHEGEAGFPHQVDHIVSRKHGGSSTFENLAYACLICNRYKELASLRLTTAPGPSFGSLTRARTAG